MDREWQHVFLPTQVAIVYTIFTNLGRKREGETSAYSICNEGVRRLPGQLDADQIDDQVRRGQM